MSTTTLSAPRGHLPKGLDDEITALALQLEEILDFNAHDKGKYKEGQPPDATQAMLEYQNEVATYLQTLNDLKLAHSIARAVDADGLVISSFINVEVQAEEDRRTAIRVSTDDPDLEAPSEPPPYQETDPTQLFILKHNNHTVESQWDTGRGLGGDGEPDGVDEPHESTYIKRQQAPLEAFSSPSSTCCACTENFRIGDTFRLECNHIFCRACLTKVIKVSMQDKASFPPTCCRKMIPLDMICSVLSEEEMEDFRMTEIEVSCTVKIYCSNAFCTKFIPPSQIIADRAHCTRCGSATCTHCLNTFHDNECPEDHSLQATLDFAADQKLQRCSGCRAIVMLAKGCNHIT